MSFLFGEKSLMPNCPLQLPVDYHAPFDRTAQQNMVEILTSLELGTNIDVPVLVASEAIWDCVTFTGAWMGTYKSSLDRPAAIVYDQSVWFDGS